MSLPQTMTAIAISRPGGPEVLVAQARAVPAPGAGEVLIAVVAAGVNRPDVLQRRGLYAPPPGASDLPGLEVAGDIVAVGAGVERWRIGDRVCALVPGGGYAPFVTVPAPQVLPVPKGLTPVEAAAIPETFFTVWHNVFERGRLAAGETLLVHGGSSGIGTTAIMLGKAFGAQVIVTVGSPEKGEACRALGADAAIDYRAGDWLPKVLEATGGRGADVILDMVCGPYAARNLQAAAMDGRIVQIATLEGAVAEIDFRLLMSKRLTLTGSTLRPQSVAAKARMAKGLEEKVWPLIAAGRIRPVIHATFPLAAAADAHRLMETSAHIGKIVLIVEAQSG